MGSESKDTSTSAQANDLSQWVYGEMWRIVSANSGKWLIVANRSLESIASFTKLADAGPIMRAHNHDLISLMEAAIEGDGVVSDADTCDTPSGFFSTPAGRYCWSHLWYIGDPECKRGPLMDNLMKPIAPVPLSYSTRANLAAEHDAVLLELLARLEGTYGDVSVKREWREIAEADGDGNES